MRISDWSSDVCSSDLSEPSFHTIARWFFWGGFQLFIFARRPLLPCNRLPCEPPNPRPPPPTSFDSEMPIGNHVEKAEVLEFIERRPRCIWVWYSNSMGRIPYRQDQRPIVLAFPHPHQFAPE